MPTGPWDPSSETLRAHIDSAIEDINTRLDALESALAALNETP